MSNENLYMQIPMIGKNKRCPICQNEVVALKLVDIAVYNVKTLQYKTIRTALLHCLHCDVCYGTENTKQRLCNNGYNAVFFGVYSNSVPADVNLKAKEFPADYVNNSQKFVRVLDTVNSKSYSKTIKQNKNVTYDSDKRKNCKINNLTIYLLSIKHTICPICNKPLSKTNITIPIDAEKSEKWYGHSCGTHFLCLPHTKLTNIVKTSVYSKSIKLNSHYLHSKPISLKDCLVQESKYCFVQETTNCLERNAKECFFQDTNAQMLIFLKSTQKDIDDMAVIISNSSSNPGENIIVLDYKDDFSRELITQIQRFKADTVLIEGNTYSVITVSRKNKYEIMPNWCLDEIVIRKLGGYSRSCVNSNFELVDVLMFSPYNNRYEVVHATYDKDECEYFIDITVYKNFVDKYGNPGLRLFVWREDKKYSKGYYDGLNDESILHAYGYNVDQKDNLSDSQRQDLLSAVIDLELMSQKAIVTLLEGNKKRKANNYFVCRKYERDIEFVINYEANPQRFIISNI